VARFAQWTLDVQDPDLMADFWSKALGFAEVKRGEDGSAKLYPPKDAPAGATPLWLQNTGKPKNGKNRFHPDLRPDDDSPGAVEAEVERLIALGARRVDVGQTGTENFVVLADPEDNEFCVLRVEPS